MTPASAPASPDGLEGMMSAKAAKSGTPSSRAMSCAPGDSGPNLYSKIPSMSVAPRPASDSATLAAVSARFLGSGAPVRLRCEYPTPAMATGRVSELTWPSPTV
jgi:hypothetical protein